MRLLHRDNAETISLTTEFLTEIPPYAILSHTWGPDEVTFQDLVTGSCQDKQGYDKIQFCSRQAWQDGYSYFWVDTCCIDKSNSVELSKAINSMFRWYRGAAKCYVHLADVSYPNANHDPTSAPRGSSSQEKQKTVASAPSHVPESTETSWKTAFQESRWFFRGWTLQELLAPTSVEFFSKEGTPLGDKKSLEQQIRDVTGIPIDALRNSSLHDFRVSERRSWMENRKTTIEEDKAYALLGLFDIQIPLIYGEGIENAMRRLDEEIEKKSKLPSIKVAQGATFDSRAEEHNAQCHPETRVDLLRQIREWAGYGKKGIFWLCGAAGTGKSTVSRTAAREFNHQDMLGASFFFKRGEADRGNADLLFPTLAFQLAVKLPRIARHIRSTLEADPTVPSKSLREQFEKLIRDPLAEVQNAQTLVIVIDALDECDPETDVRAILHLFSQYHAPPAIRVQIFLTSRPELSIRDCFSQNPGEYEGLILHEISSSIVEQDIHVFLRDELVSIREKFNKSVPPRRRLASDWPGKRDLQALVQKASPLFICAFTICRFLKDRKMSTPGAQLAKILNYEATSFDFQLEGAYQPVLDDLIAGHEDIDQQTILEQFRLVVGSIVLLFEPLSVLSLAQLLGTDINAMEALLDHLHSVLSIPEDLRSPIRLIHLSFHEFLVKTRNQALPFWIDKVARHSGIASKCIHVMSGHLRKNIGGLKTPSSLRTELDPNSANVSIPAHVRYACLYWVHHVKRGKVVIRDGDHMHNFLKNHFLHWLEVLCLIGKIFESLSMLETLQNHAESGTNIQAFLRDAGRYIRNYIQIITIYPLQLYSLAMVFRSGSSIIQRSFGIEASDSMPDILERGLEWNMRLERLATYEVISEPFSPDRQSLVSGSNETIQIRDHTASFYEEIARGFGGILITIAFSPDGRFFVSRSDDFNVEIRHTIGA